MRKIVLCVVGVCMQLLAGSAMAGGINIPPFIQPGPRRTLEMEQAKHYFEGMRDFWAAHALIEDAVLTEVDIINNETGDPNTEAVEEARSLFDSASNAFAQSADACYHIMQDEGLPEYYSSYYPSLQSLLQTLADEADETGDALDSGDVDTALALLTFQDSMVCGGTNSGVTSNSLSVAAALDDAMDVYLDLVEVATAVECQ